MSILPGDLRLAAQFALLGFVTPNLRAVTIDFDYRTIYVNFYYNNFISNEEKDSALKVANNLSEKCRKDEEGYPNSVKTKIALLHYPAEIPHAFVRVFHRKEK